MSGRRVAAAIADTAEAARALGQGNKPHFRPTRVEELDALQASLAEAGELLARERDAREAAEAERARLFDSEQAARQLAESQNRAKDEFLAMLGHELRNPLSAITTSSHVLRASPPGSRMQSQAQVIIERQGKQMARLVEDLLDISRLTMGKVALHPEAFDLAQLASQLVMTWEQSGRAAPGRIRTDLESAWVVADRARMEQVVANLLDNANRFTPEGACIHLRVRSEEGSSVLQVQDEGAGIDPAVLGQVFKPFAQAPQGVDRSHGGLGLGLAVVERLVHMHGGRVEAASEGLGKGATFTVRLPAGEIPERTDPQPQAPRREPASGLRVLVIEDGEDAREMMRALLTLHGHTVCTCGDGESGVAEAENFDPDIALLDIGLPGIDGYEVARRLRAMPQGREIFLVALTGYGQSEDEAAAYRAGFDRHMTKPVEPAALARMLSEVVPRRASQPAE
jgi:signal transduction histidine kinase/ActR/RegA family two-component response regulator